MRPPCALPARRLGDLGATDLFRGKPLADFRAALCTALMILS